MNSFGDRMKKYEGQFDLSFNKDAWIFLRLDGKSFHTITKNIDGFNLAFHELMSKTAMLLCENISNSVLGYTQSDEITICLKPNNNAEPWFGNRLFKIIGISASIASVYFSKQYGRDVQFDCRVFAVPEYEVPNVFIWRQQEAIRSSIQLIGQQNFSSNQLYKKNCNDILEMIKEKGIIWEELSNRQKYGSVILKKLTSIFYDICPKCKQNIKNSRCENCGIEFPQNVTKQVWMIEECQKFSYPTTSENFFAEQFGVYYER